MVKKYNISIVTYVLILFLFNAPIKAQLKFLLEDFEGFTDGVSDLKNNGVFTFGFSKASIVNQINEQPHNYSGQRALKLQREANANYGGWGKGIGLNLVLDPNVDYLNFYTLFPLTIPLVKASNILKIELQEDDDGDNVFNKENDDIWTYTLTIENVSNQGKKEDKWELISIPLNQFDDDNHGGDGVFNINYKQGKLFSFVITFEGQDKFREKQECYFDFICFSKGKLPTGARIFDAPAPSKTDLCSLGAFSTEGNKANFIGIAGAFENNFEYASEKKLGIIHLFQPFGMGDGTKTNYPSVEKLNKIIKEGYVPMITIENHFINTINPKMKQPNLYSILEGHFDSFLGHWAGEIKQVKGTVLIRMLHEFNGDWYPWSLVNNDKNPKLLAKAFRYIHDIFISNNVTNVKFIWCPNSMSIPQEPWNYIMDAYPGDNYVDYVGLDIYNGAGNSVIWRSFRKEAIENYFILTEQLSTKPLLICETASRERKKDEKGALQNKAGWIKDMSEALKTDLSKFCLLTWFNEKETFKVNSSKESKDAFLNYIMKDDYFKSGTEYFFRK